MEDVRRTEEILLNKAVNFSDMNNIDSQDLVQNDHYNEEENITNISSRIAAEIFINAESGPRSGSNINLVVDSYVLDSKREKYSRPYVNRLVAINGLANRPHDCDLLLDQSYYKNLESRYDGLAF